jgi:NADH dehydrogenase
MELFRAKHAAEHALRASKLRGTVVRATAFAELWIELLRQTAARGGRPLVFGTGENPINFVSTRDVAALVTLVLTDETTRGQAFDLGGPDNLTFNDLAQRVQTADGRTGAPRHIPRAMMRTLAHTLGRLNPQLGRQVRASLAMDSEDLTFDSSATHARFPQLPTTSIDQLLA